MHKGIITPHGNKYINRIISSLNTLADKVPVLCLSAKSDNILLWSHYANSHRGYCIEYRAKRIDAENVIYKPDAPTIKIKELLPTEFEDYQSITGCKIKKALLTKLIDWKHENEYRFILFNAVKTTPIDEFRCMLPYEPDFIESIIFGSRMPPHIKEYIINNMPYKTILKQAYELDYSIEIRQYLT